MLEKEIRTFYDSYINDIEIQSENLNPEKKHELQESLKEIKSAQNFLVKCSYILKFKSTHFSIFLINNSQDEILNIRIIHLCKRLEFLYKYLNFQNPFNFNIWLIPLSIKRIFPNDSVQISFNNINGGFTYVNGNDIYEDEEEEEEEEEEEVWECDYCEKEFEDENDCEKHEKYCKSKSNKKKNACYRCGRSGHYSDNCYAKTDKDGYQLDDDSDDDSD